MNRNPTSVAPVFELSPVFNRRTLIVVGPETMLAETTNPISVALALMTPLVAIPLTLITFYLRTMREHQLAAHAQLERRVEACESKISEVRRALSERDRDFATKEEWLRETMYARRTLDELRDALPRRSPRKKAHDPDRNVSRT